MRLIPRSYFALEKNIGKDQENKWSLHLPILSSSFRMQIALNIIMISSPVLLLLDRMVNTIHTWRQMGRLFRRVREAWRHNSHPHITFRIKEVSSGNMNRIRSLAFVFYLILQNASFAISYATEGDDMDNCPEGLTGSDCSIPLVRLDGHKSGHREKQMVRNTTESSIHALQ